VNESVKSLVALDPNIDREAIRAALPGEPDIHVVGLVDGFEESWQTLQETDVDLLLVACEGYSDRALVLIEGAVRQRPDRPVVVLTTGSSNGFVRRVFEAGADDILTVPQSPEHVLFALQKAVARKEGAAAASGVAASPLVCVLGPKGGTGKTLTACNLTTTMAEAGRRTVLVDLDLQFGDVGLSLGLTPEKTIYDLAKSGGSLDDEKLDAYLATHASGARVLMAPTRPDQAGLVTVEFLRDLYAALRATNDFVVVDTPPGFTPEVIASIDSSSDACVVAMLDSLSLKNTKLALETLELMGYDREHIRFVLNRADTKVGISSEEVAAIVGRTPDVLVPSDREIPCALNEGIPIVLANERSEASRAFRSLASLYLKTEPQAKLNGRSTLFRRLRRRS
jgi:pilus assembly protein CpaE